MCVKEHKAITFTRVGDGVHEPCRVAGDGRPLFCVYIARTVTQPRCKAEMMARGGMGKSTLGELTLVGAQ